MLREARYGLLKALEPDGARVEKFFSKKISYFKDHIAPNMHAPPQTLGVNRRRAVEYAHMNVPVMQNSSSSDTPKASSGSSRSFFTYTVIALGLALFIRFFIAAPYVVQGASMEPTFNDWHYLIIDRLSYDITEPKRGDVIVFDLPQDTSRSLIKRIIGLPTETVVLKGQSVTIINTEHPKGFTLAEPYLDPANLTGSNEMEVTLGADQFFVLGDNRRVSADSRLWGTLPRNDIVGRVFLRLFPFQDISLLPGEVRYSN